LADAIAGEVAGAIEAGVGESPELVCAASGRTVARSENRTKNRQYFMQLF